MFGTPTTAFGDIGMQVDGQGSPEGGRDAARRSAHEEILRRCIDAASTGLAMFDREIRYLAASHTYRDGHGLGDQGIIGRCIYDVLPERAARPP